MKITGFFCVRRGSLQVLKTFLFEASEKNNQGITVLLVIYDGSKIVKYSII